MDKKTVCIAVVGVFLLGCSAKPNWPESSTLSGPPGQPTCAHWSLLNQGNYLQEYRGGVKRVLKLDREGDGTYELLADLDELDARQIRHVLVMLDGIPFNLLDELYREGSFRLFYPPGQLVGPLPSSTEVSFPMILGVPGTSAIEAEFFVPSANRVSGGNLTYLSGDNEFWSAGLDYRQSTWLDAVGYLRPVWGTRREHASMLKKAEALLRDQPDQRIVAVYGVCTDCLCHMVSREKAKELLRELDRRLEALVFATGGQVGLTILADHGNNMVPDCQRVQIPEALKRAGLVHVDERGFRHPREVVIAPFGLVSFAAAYCQNEEDRAATVDALLSAEGVEHALWRRGDVVHIRGHRGLAEIRRLSEGGADYCSYDCIEGDPLDYKAALSGLPAEAAISRDGRTYYAGRAVLAATVDHDYPDALWRSWQAFDDVAMVVPDVLASLAPGWYYGEPGIDAWTSMNGTHGGLRRDDSNTFFTSTAFVPPAVLRASDVPRILEREIGWQPKTLPPEQNKLLKYFPGDDGGKTGRRNLP